MPSVTLGFTVTKLFKVSMLGRVEAVETVVGALIVGFVLPSGVKVVNLEGVLEKMLYKFLGEGLVSVEALVSRGIVRPSATVTVAVTVAGVVKAGTPVSVTFEYNFLEEIEGSASVPGAWKDVLVTASL